MFPTFISFIVRPLKRSLPAYLDRFLSYLSDVPVDTTGLVRLTLRSSNPAFPFFDLQLLFLLPEVAAVAEWHSDHQARRRFVEWAQNQIAVVLDFHKRILFSDEAHFWLNGYVDKQNCRIWSEANPQVYVETPLHPEKLTVWCAFWAGGIIGPYFFKILLILRVFPFPGIPTYSSGAFECARYNRRYQLPQVILMPSFLLRARHLSSDDAKLNLRIFLKNFGSQAKWALQGIFYMPNNRTTWPFMTAVHFLHHENSPTWAGDEPATLGADGQQQTNFATQSALAEL
ncbi:uncharacterized protein TNCV_5115301 [Trichonephila clavipes]|nr:uncharacterized protein TNCV_5115301 [Trichonephila clavipes]